MATEKNGADQLADHDDGEAKGGRPRIELNVEVLKASAGIGCTVEEICAAMIAAGIQLNVRTLKRRLNEDYYRDIYEAARAQFKFSLRRLQFRHAQMPNSAGVQMTIHMSKHQLGETEKSLLELTGKDGGAIQTEDVSARAVIESRLAGIAAKLGTTSDSGGAQ